MILLYSTQSHFKDLEEKECLECNDDITKGG